MVGGVYFSAVGSIPWEVYAASVPYGLLCTTVLMGKHVDKAPWDEKEGIRTLPVILGDTRALALTRGMMAGFYVTTAACVALGALPWPTLVVAAGLPTLVKAWGPLTQPKPAEPPKGFPIWPLWYAAIAFLHTRRAGLFLVVGLVVAAVAGIEPGFLS